MARPDPIDMTKLGENVNSQKPENNTPMKGRPFRSKNKPKCLTIYSNETDTKEVTEVNRGDFYKICQKRRSERNSANSSVEQREENMPLLDPQYLE